MASTTISDPPNTLSTVIDQFFSETKIEACDRALWSDRNGYDCICKLATEEDSHSLKVALQGKSYAISSLAAVIAYYEKQGTSFAPNTLRMRYELPDDTMMVDVSAIQALEVMQNLNTPNSKACLLGLLNHTITPMGGRTLRTSILQPSTQPQRVIYPRYDVIKEFIDNGEMFRDARQALKSFFDVERLLTKFIVISTVDDVVKCEEQIERILMIKGFLEAILEFHTALSPASCALLVKARDICSPEISSPIIRKIRTVIEADVTYVKSALDLRNQRCFAVKAGISGYLDLLRQAYKELTGDVHQLVDDLKEKHEITVQLKYDNSRKYWLKLNVGEYSRITSPSIFINTIKKPKHIECQTLELVKLNMRISETSESIVEQSNDVIQELACELRQFIPQLFRMCESIGLIDMLASFAHVAHDRHYVRPEFTSTLALRAAKHPIMDRTTTGDFVPNDYYATDNHRFNIVTGCNMSGKTTYIRAITLLQIMAQIGSYVPATYASFTIIRCIFARITTNDKIEANLSSFSLEMREMAFILRNIDDSSLVIIDELGRGTATQDGLAIAMAVSEALIQSKAFVWFATHFADIAKSLHNFPGVLTLHLQSRILSPNNGMPELTMMYKVESGIVDDSQQYGLHLARAMGLPKKFVDDAEEASNYLRQMRLEGEVNSEERKTVQKRQAILKLYDSLKQANEYGNPDVLYGYLKKLQEDFVVRMVAIDKGTLASE
ncbi:hypothetical protein VHEMI09348 [[Torrubiella] hemipterigena]|uniref:DNA mismatch repair protein MSH3 n=1 Tax=[Torrubiella] hemipterigena TaxID=1531966 RepID=A0A0A1TG59_9HYPO|nr:hypothetical protein VHEMI09348 [[Torrubiella] hemipterigena]